MGDDDFLEAGKLASHDLLIDLRKMADTLVRLEFEYVTAKEKMEQAEKTYNEFKSLTLPNAFRMAGIMGLDTNDGAHVSITRKYYCSPNKNEADQDIMCNWLEQNGGEDLIKRKAIVDEAQIQRLKEAAIPHTQKRDVNTQSLKAWLKRAIGDDKNVATIELENIPSCMHFVMLDEAEVKI